MWKQALGVWKPEGPWIVPLGMQAFQLNKDCCIDFTVDMHAGDFFMGLEPVEAPNGPRFRKGTEFVHHYPDKLTVWVQVIEASESDLGYPCNKVLKIGLENPTSAEDLVKSLRFEAQWKRGFELRSAQILSVELSQPDWPEWRWTHFWLYVLTIPAERIPLTDNLVVSVFLGSGEESQLLGRFSGRPDYSPPVWPNPQH